MNPIDNNNIKDKRRYGGYYRCWIFKKNGTNFDYRLHNIPTRQDQNSIKNALDDLKRFYTKHNISNLRKRTITAKRIKGYLKKYCAKDFVLVFK